MLKEEYLKIIMCSQITEKFFNLIIKQKVNDLQVVYDCFDISSEQLRSTVHEMCFIPGMEVRICNTAIDFLIDQCTEFRDKGCSLRQTISECILAAGVYYTNIAPDAISTNEAIKVN